MLYQEGPVWLNSFFKHVNSHRMLLDNVLTMFGEVKRWSMLVDVVRNKKLSKGVGSVCNITK